jgi:hypothetical protein
MSINLGSARTVGKRDSTGGFFAGDWMDEVRLGATDLDWVRPDCPRSHRNDGKIEKNQENQQLPMGNVHGWTKV